MRLSAIARVARERQLPCAFVDLDAFDDNVAATARLAQGKRVRIATKSLRVPALIERVLARGAPFAGVMAFDAREAEHLVMRGIDDVLVAYPCVDRFALAALKRAHEVASARGGRVSLVVDGVENVDALAAAMTGAAQPFPAIVELDMSLRVAVPGAALAGLAPGGAVHLGVRRSPVRSADDVLALVDEIAARPSLTFGGVMGYEAQVAGLGDVNAPRGALAPKERALDLAKRAVRAASVAHAKKLRAEVAAALAKRGVALDGVARVFNGGGTGSLDTSSAEPWLTEVTAGSALYAPHLFDHYSNVAFAPSCFFALRVVRASDVDDDGRARFVTCAGGGYVASGEPGWSKVPLPVWPEGVALVDTEACGEVQTPLAVTRRVRDDEAPRVGDVVLFRHAKAGELFERLDRVVLLKENGASEEAPSYRGLGWCFA